MKLRIRKMPRPLLFSMFSGASGSATSSGSKPSPSSRTATVSPPVLRIVRRDELDVHQLALVVLVAVLDRVDHALADRDADPVHRVFVEAEPAAQVIADDLHEVEHVERTAELETDDVGLRAAHAAGTRGGCSVK